MHVEHFNHELNYLNFSENIDVNEMYESFTNTFSKITDRHTQLKKKNCLSKPVPNIKKQPFKQAVYKKGMLFD